MTVVSLSLRGRFPTVGTRDEHDADGGSVTPLVIGMMLCLLLLGAGVIAAGSAVLARRNLQSACDGATASLAAGVTLDQLAAGTGDFDRQIASYLATRMPGAFAVTGSTGTEIIARCETDAPVTFGAIFGHPSVHFTVGAASRIFRA
jgi:Flp pilus assembly protein TadG